MNEEMNSSRFFRNTACEYFPCHQGIDEKGRNAEKIGFPIGHNRVAENTFNLILQAVRHVDEKEDAGGEEVDKAQEESGPIGVLISHVFSDQSFGFM